MALMKPLRHLAQDLLQRLITPTTLSLGDGSLAGELRGQWSGTAPGGYYRFQTRDPRHEACAVATAQGWLLEDVQRDEAKGLEVFTLQKPLNGSLNPHTPDWLSERTFWRGSEASAQHSLPCTAPLRCSSDRRCHIIGVGIAKSGTRSLAGLFSRFHSTHEFDAVGTIQRAVSGVHLDDASWLHERDARAGFLECDSSQLHHWHLAEMVSTFPTARFVLTIRDPRAWLDSLFNHRLARGMSPVWWPIEEKRFGPRCTDIEGPEQLLAEMGRPSLAGALAFWAEHHLRALEVVPPARLLVVRVERLGDEVKRIAKFAGVAADTLTPEIAHQNTARARFHLLDRLPAAHLESTLQECCGALWQRLTTLADHA
jgi:Sulfotransferase domain